MHIDVDQPDRPGAFYPLSSISKSFMKPPAAIVLMGFIVLAAAGCESRSSSTMEETADQLKAHIENKHPATYYKLAGKLFQDGQKDEAVFWFYLGQLRYRFHLATARNLDPSGDPALFASLSEVVGRPLNEYAFGDIPKLAEAIDKVLEWDATHENGFTPKKGNEATLQAIRDGLLNMKTTILKDQDKIKAMRKEHGLQ
jgi:hypothetical protein